VEPFNVTMKVSDSPYGHKLSAYIVQTTHKI